MNSVWTNTTSPPEFEPLSGNLKTDVLIIGGGISGILCAYMLKKAGIDCALVEARRICSGISRNTTAKITLQHGLIYDKMLKKFGYEKTSLYLEAQLQAMYNYSEICRGLDCDYEKKSSVVYTLKDKSLIEKEIIALSRLGIKSEFKDKIPLPFEVLGAVSVANQAEFHPLKFAYEIAKGLPIYEKTKVTELMPHRAKTENGEIVCKKMIIATHFPILNKQGGYFLKMYQHRSYVIALEGGHDLSGMYVDEDEKGMSFRNYGNMLFIGGGGHRTGKNGGNWRELEQFAKKHYPTLGITNKWAAQDCMTLDGIPYIGRYSKTSEDLYVATGFNKWGMTNAMVAATLLTDLIRGKTNDFEEVFSPTRSIFHPQLVINAFESVLGIITPTLPRCPHLGCALKYNKDEHSWDCPCHGSRFTEAGQLIDNPATDDKQINPRP